MFVYTHVQVLQVLTTSMEEDMTWDAYLTLTPDGVRV